MTLTDILFEENLYSKTKKVLWFFFFLISFPFSIHWMGCFQKTFFIFRTYFFRALVLAKTSVNMGYGFALSQEIVIPCLSRTDKS